LLSILKNEQLFQLRMHERPCYWLPGAPSIVHMNADRAW
jgi:hypothetical protein